jgi:ABC-type multidrug transport system fused ATPase/permease subunit
LARLIYRKALCDVFILDDPLSAVDVSVGSQMFEQGIAGALRGKTRLVVLNSHLHFLPRFDCIFVVDRDADSGIGCIVAQGTYAELLPNYRALMSAGSTSDPEFDDASSDSDEKTSSNSRRIQDGAAAWAERKNSSSSSGGNICRRNRSFVFNGSAGGGGNAEVAKASAQKHDVVLDIEDAAAKRKTKEEEEDNTGSLMSTEDRVVGAITTRTYRYYMDAAMSSVPSKNDDDGEAEGEGSQQHHFQLPVKRPCLGVLIIVVLVAAYVITQSSRIAADLWLATWGRRDEGGSHTDEFWIVGAYCAIALIVLLVIARSMLFVYVTISASIALHEQLFNCLVRAPTSTFFDVTPVGRVLSRFAADFAEVDVLLPDFSSQFFHHATNLASAVVLAAVASYWTILCFLPVFYVFYKLQKFFRTTSRELKRVEGITR